MTHDLKHSRKDDALKMIPGLALVNDDLVQVERKMRQAPHDGIEPLTVALDTLLKSGGKRLRPALALLAGRLYKPPSDQIFALAAAVEMLHTATLVHDDLIDSALLRRGNSTLNAIWSPGATVLTGDFLFAWAANLAAQTRNIPVMNIFSRTIMVICGGELRQLFGLPWREQTRQDYDRRIYAKTASLFAAATEAAAVLNNASESQVQALGEYGHQLGMAFQIVDDVLDFVGSSEEMGKPVGSDMRQGIVTLPIIYYLAQNPDDELLAQIFAGQAANGTIEIAVTRIRECGAVDAAMHDAQIHIQQAQAALNGIPASDYRQAMSDLAEFVTQRRI